MRLLARTRNPLSKKTLFCIALIAACLLLAAPSVAEDEPIGNIGLHVARSHIISTDWDVANISVADANIADVQVATPRQVVVVGKKTGVTDLVMWGDEGESVHTRVSVTLDVESLQGDLDRFFPNGELKVAQRDEAVIVSGTLRRAEEIEDLNQFMAAKGIAFVDMTSLAGVQQVMLRVKIAEASRNAVRMLGVNALQGGSDFFSGSTIGGNPNGINIGAPDGAGVNNIPFSFNNETSMSSSVTLFAGFPQSDLQFFLQALEDNQYLRILAEPNLVCLSGEQAEFLAGGEVPIPIVQGSGAGAGSTITIEYKEFGVRLNFEPQVMGDGSIRLHVEPEVSDVSEINAVAIEGFSIPSFTTRRAQTTLELKNGQTFAMAGLIDRSSMARAQRVPALGRVPLFGSLFRSVRYQNRESEMIVLVTANLVEPLSMTRRRPLPGDLHQSPSDWELYSGGRLESREPAMLSGEDMLQIRELGLHELRGPGTWATYDQESNPVKDEDTNRSELKPEAEEGESIDEEPATEPDSDDSSSVE